MKLVLSNDFAKIKDKYIETIDLTPDMEKYARWIYGQHPTDSIIQSYIENNEMYIFSDGRNIAGMMAITMYQGEDYHEINWKTEADDEEVAVIHIFAVCPEYQKKGIGKRMIEEAISLAKKNGKKAIRLDAIESNIPAHHICESMGFEYRGKENRFAENTGWIDFMFFEMILNDDKGIIENLFERLTDKNDKAAYDFSKKISAKSAESDEYYKYFDVFLNLITAKKSYVKTRGFVLCCAQARWDSEGKLLKSISSLLALLHDEKPTVIRQCLCALHEVALYRPELNEYLKSEIEKMDLQKYKDSMKPLIQKDIEELVEML